MASKVQFKKILLTGASGALGTVLREGLKPYVHSIRLSDVNPLPNPTQDAVTGEEFIAANLADKQAIFNLVQGCDAILHFGGKSVEGHFDEVLEANIKGVYNIYEAARIHGVKRVIFASSNHAIGFHPVTTNIDSDCLQRPDSNYGVSKAYGDRYGIESVCLRIGSSFPKPKDRRMLVTWLSYRDLVELVRCSLACPRVDHTIVYGVSNNKGSWWDNSKAGHLGYQPQDNSEAFRDEMESLPVDAQDPATRFQGGGYVKMGPW
jgi:uronate dehydrogenase